MLSGRCDRPVIVGVLLAAGAGSRFGGGKLLARLPDGTPLGVRAARTLRSGVDGSVAVVRPSDQALAALLEAEGLDVARFPGADDGMGASLAFGVSAVPDADGWIVALADMPFVRPETVETVAGMLRGGALIAAPCHQGRRGHPVGFSRALFPELIRLGGDHGARALLDRYAGQVELFESGDPGIFLDIDTLRDLPGGRSDTGDKFLP
ncbi:MAG: nucleotidyltransferase family protein [Holophagales bacterium]|nr:nucleotidyltransferase family protein [Holophagales bacterium]